MATVKLGADLEVLSGGRLVVKHFDNTGMTPAQVNSAIAVSRGAAAPPVYWTDRASFEAANPTLGAYYPLIAAVWYLIQLYYASTSNIIWIDFMP